MKRLLIWITAISTIFASSLINSTIVINKSNSPIDVFFQAWGCFGLKTGACPHIDRVCKKKYQLQPNEQVTYNWGPLQSGKNVYIEYNMHKEPTPEKYQNINWMVKNSESYVDWELANLRRVKYSKKISGNETIEWHTIPPYWTSFSRQRALINPDFISISHTMCP